MGRKTDLGAGVKIKLVVGEATFDGKQVASVIILPVSPATPES